MKNKLGFIVSVAATIAVSGCSTNITHEYHSTCRPFASKAEAVIALQRLGVINYDNLAVYNKGIWKEPVLLAICPDGYIMEVNENRFLYGYLPPIVGWRPYRLIHGRKIYLPEAAGDLPFASIDKIELGKFCGQALIKLHYFPQMMQLCCPDDPEIYDEALSALLMLCPNVK